MTDQSKDLVNAYKLHGGPITEAELKLKAQPLVEAFGGRLPLKRELADINEHFGIAMAMAVFAQGVEAADRHGPFLRRLRSLSIPKSKIGSAQSFDVAIIPSTLPQSGREWGSHVETWRAWARELGFQTTVIETDPKAPVVENARTIARKLISEPHPLRILVSYGQGSAEVRRLLERKVIAENGSAAEPTFGYEWSGIAAWINVCGAIQGSTSSQLLTKSFARRALSNLRMRAKGRNPNVLLETSADQGFWRKPYQIPSGLKVINIVGLPFMNSVPQGLRHLYYQMATQGPNDGVVDLYESLVQPGWIVPILEMSHRAEDYKLKPLLQRSLVALAESSAELAPEFRPVL